LNLLLDTHLLIWAAAGSTRLAVHALRLIGDPGNRIVFSTVSIWEIVIKNSRGYDDFRVDPYLLRQRLLENGYDELVITCAHALAVGALPLLHADPFDRLLIAQANVEGLSLLTSDARVASYPGQIVKV
jgi:PIN domain nuclease of toxin-antitoxin system